MNRAGKPRIGVFGAGWVGLVTGACFAELGHDVVVRDVLPERIEALQAGRIPLHEPGLAELVERNVDRLTFTLELDEVSSAPLMFVCVGTPPTYSGDADLSAVWTVVDQLPALDERAILVMKSTVPVGTGDKVRAALDARGLAHVGYVSNPEFLSEGSAVDDFMRPDRVVVGSFTEADAATVASLYQPLDTTVVQADVASAEMIKLAANAFLMTRISFINEIANVCEATGADVVKVAEGVGLDHRLGPHFLRAGIGWGGSCLAGGETVVVRRDGRVRLIELERLFAEAASDRAGEPSLEVATPRRLEVLAWRPDGSAPEYLPVACVTRRPFDGDLLEIRTKMGRRVRVTPDHPFVVSDSDGESTSVRRADELTAGDWLPLALGAPEDAAAWRVPTVLAADRAGAQAAGEIIVRPRAETAAALQARALQPAIASLGHARGAVARSHDIVRAGALRLDEADAISVDLTGATIGTVSNGTYVPVELEPDERFWRVVGLYIAEGHCVTDGRRRRLTWSFHPTDERDLVEEVAGFWASHGVKAHVHTAPTATNVRVSSRLLAGWWLDTLGLGANCYEQRLPDAVWSAPSAHKRALLAGLWRGDGSWSYVAGGPSVVLEYGTVSRELADGLLRLLGDLGVVARLKVGRTAKSTRDTYWLVISGADQVETLLELVPECDRPAVRTSLRRQAKRIAPTGYRRRGASAWLRVTGATAVRYSGPVYSLEVPGAETFVTTHGLVVHNCFPKDGVALKQLASNSGYHFQLLNAVIEVNELQKRRVVGKLEKHLGKLRGKTVALLGLAFKPNTDDLREAPSLVLASRLLAEGADVRAWDPVADASRLLQGVTFCETVLEAVADADAAVIVTEWDELRGLASDEIRQAMRRPLIVDGRNLLDPEEARSAGFAYEGIGRAASPLEALPETEEPTTPQEAAP